MIEAIYRQRVALESDINEHMPVLCKLASECSHVTEFGVRTGNSTVAFLYGLPAKGRLVSYDIELPQCNFPVNSPRWQFHEADTGKLCDIAHTDMLFIDTLHTFRHVEAELKHAHRVKKYIAFHDTVIFGENGELGQEGINRAIDEFMQNNPEWRVKIDLKNNNGLLVIERMEKCNSW